MHFSEVISRLEYQDRAWWEYVEPNMSTRGYVIGVWLFQEGKKPTKFNPRGKAPHEIEHAEAVKQGYSDAKLGGVTLESLINA